jgi:serine/threonine protein kinase/dienelactone hydrolase
MNDDFARPRLVPGAQLGPYRLEAELGTGGMGEVFRAQDTRLGRTVAIKLIRPELAQRVDLQHRFDREARAISALNHPHICSLHDIGEQNGMAYLVMEYVDGQTLSERLTQAPLPVDVALEYGAQIADALAAAHAQGLVHRDLKPANVMITPAGVKVLDFGLAKRSHDAAPDQPTEMVSTRQTRAGQMIGTVAYMSPEQAEGRPVDARSDVFSFGVVLYEMLCGVRPFTGDTPLSTAAAILREPPTPPRKLRPEISDSIERLVLRCLEKSPKTRYASGAEVLRELHACRTTSLLQRGSSRRRNVLAATVLVAVVIGTVIGVRSYTQTTRSRWAEREALPEVTRLMTVGRPLQALGLLQQVEQYLPSSPEAIRLRDALFVSDMSIRTEPAGADLFIRDYADTESEETSGWRALGPSPVEGRLPRGYYRLRAVKEGFGEVERAIGLSGTARDDLLIRLHAGEETPPGMVWIPGIGAGNRGTGESFPAVAPSEAPPYWIDRHEVTNREFKVFVDQGGYQKREYWTHPFIKDGRAISWMDAMAEFRDATGRPGPATWQLGTYPEGKADFPVSGVSWYEAVAYAAFVGKSLPTVYHWVRAAVGATDILKFANFDGRGSTAVGSSRSLSSSGTFDMAGNVKEWTSNPTADLRYILGGGWTEPSYMFVRPDARRPFDRDATFGFRCVTYIAPIDESLTGSVPITDRDRRKDKPVDASTFEVYRALHAYDKTDLKAAVDAVDESSPYWRKETISFQAAYGDERVIAHLYLPKGVKPPYHVTTAFLGTGTLAQRSFGDGEAYVNFGFIIRSGRAVILPAYKGTLERGPAAYYHLLGQPNLWREMNLQWSKDLGRTIDYLETRPDLDISRVSYLGGSMGAAMAPRLLALEPRIKAAILISGGSFERVPPEVDNWNFAPHVTTPVLMLNGRDDFLFPLETSQIPLFRLLGTPEKDKRHIVYDGGHDVGNTGIRLDVVKESLSWLDRYLGPVATN